MMHRLFVAVAPTPSVCDALLSAMGGVASARWQRDDQLHLTLRFVGEVDRHAAVDVAAALGGVRHPAFAVRLGAPGTFDKRGRVDSLWVGVTPPEPLHTLHNKVDAALTRAGIAPDGRAFHPHITIARFGRRDGWAAAGFVPLSSLDRIGFTVDGFTLFESTLSEDGAIYRAVERYAMAR